MNYFATPLCKLAFKYGADKCPQLGHSYTGFYYELFKDKTQKVKKVVEIGIGWGSSLYMWQEFFPNAKIYGADINKDLLFNTNRIKSFCCDQTNKSDLKNLIDKVGKNVDLFIDDGSHNPEDKVFACLTFMPILSKKTVYAIEDVAHKEIVKKLTMYDCQFKRRSKMIRHDDRLLLVRHK